MTHDEKLKALNELIDNEGDVVWCDYPAYGVDLEDNWRSIGLEGTFTAGMLRKIADIMEGKS